MSNVSKGRQIGSALSSVCSFAWAKTKQGAGEAKAFSKEFAAGAKESWNPTLQAKAQKSHQEVLIETAKKCGIVKDQEPKAEAQVIEVEVVHEETKARVQRIGKDLAEGKPVSKSDLNFVRANARKA
jgi:hypothetical protein